MSRQSANEFATVEGMNMVQRRRLAQMELPHVNHKRVYRIMGLYGLLVTRHTGRQPERAHDGKVITLRHNLRWSADDFEIACTNAETVWVVFTIDCCDREPMGFVAITRRHRTAPSLWTSGRSACICGQLYLSKVFATAQGASICWL